MIPLPDNELSRILSLSQRPPLNCERGKDRKWAPEAQALINEMTAKFTRGKRISCACRNRVVKAIGGGRLLVFTEEGRPDRPSPPPLPFEVSMEDFCHDDWESAEEVGNLAAGQSIKLPGLGYSFCMTELNPVQAWVLKELPLAGGIFGMISVGSGKSLCSILAPLAVDCRTAVLLAKPTQRIHYKRHYLRAREHFKVPSMVFDDDGGTSSYIIGGVPILHFIPYSLLSNPKSTLLLEQLKPGMVVADEWHLLANRASSRTLRFLRFMAKNGDVKLAGWSGSTIKKTIRDCSHLAAHSLGLKSPYPIKPDDVEAWASVIDPSPIPDRKSTTARALLKAFGTNQKLSPLFEVGLGGDAGIREGHRNRVISTVGVVSTVSSSVTCSISIRERKAPPIPDAVKKALAGIRQDAVRPDGEELVEAVEIITCARNAAAGFYELWVYPRGEPEELIERWFAARKAWNKELRVKLRNGEPHLDSPSLCEKAAERAWQTPRYDGTLPVWPAESWIAWRNVKDLVKPEPKVRWIDDYLARDAAQWALENQGGIVWCQSRAFGLKVAQLSKLPYHAGGPNAEANILAEDGSRSIVASLDAHGESRDGLQFRFSKQLIAEPPSSGDRWEQALGRLAREGQEAETIDTDIYIHVAENRDAFRKALSLAEFIEATTPNRQLLLAADIEFSV